MSTQRTPPNTRSNSQSRNQPLDSADAANPANEGQPQISDPYQIQQPQQQLSQPQLQPQYSAPQISVPQPQHYYQAPAPSSDYDKEIIKELMRQIPNYDGSGHIPKF